MSFDFLTAPANTELRQGELLGDVWLLRAVAPASAPAADDRPEVVPTHHPYAIVLQSDCDLLQDFNARKRAVEAGEAVSVPKSLLQILLCDAFGEADIKPLVNGSDIWKRVKKNQDERYHSLEFNPLVAIAGVPSSPLYLDFRRAFSVFTEDLYAGLLNGGVRRFGVIPPVYLQDLMHRFFGYLSRVGLPE